MKKSTASSLGIQLVELTKIFGDHTAVDSLNLEIPRGCVFGFLGPNGSGKSTTIRMLTGILTIDSGDALVMGISVRQDALSVKRIVGVVPDNLALFEYLTVREHLDLVRCIFDLKADVYKYRSTQLLTLLQLDRDVRQLAKHCSYGTRKKLSLAMALLHNPSVLVLDEPFEGLDPVMVATVKRALKLAAKRGTTVFLTTHALDSVDDLLDMYAIIRSGVLLARGEISSLRHQRRTIKDEYLDHFLAEGQPELEWLG